MVLVWLLKMGGEVFQVVFFWQFQVASGENCFVALDRMNT